MDPPAAVSVESKSKPEQTNEPKPNPKSYDCGLCDTEVVYKIAQELLPGLASACVDNTTGGLFKNAGSVAVDMRKEMSDYLTQRSETYVAEFLLSESAPVLEISEHPYDIVITLIDDFTALKRNMFSRVSEWVFSDGREDRIDDFVQEMEINGFWLLARRECIASILLKNVDYKNSFHCNTVCASEEEAVKHRSECKFRPMDCVNEGCTTRYCAASKENHEAVCPFMILPCEQKCSDFVMRREMDRHCVTICPMKLVNCAFYTVGCKSCIPRSNVQQHNVDDLSAHLGFIIRTAHKDMKEDDLKHRVDQIRSLTNTEKLARARDARALTYLIKDAEAKLGPLEAKTELPDSPTHDDISKIDPPTETEPLIVKDASKSPTKTEPSVVKNVSESDSAVKKEDQGRPVSPPLPEVKPSTEKPAMEEVHQEPPPKAVESTESLVKVDESKDKHESSSSVIEKVEGKSEAPLKKEEGKSEAPLKKDEGKSESPLKKEEGKSEAPLKKEEGKSEAPFKKEEGKSEAPLKKEESRDLKEEEESSKEKGKPIDSKEEERGRSTEGGKVEESVKSSMEEKSTSDDQEDKKKSSPKKEESAVK